MIGLAVLVVSVIYLYMRSSNNSNQNSKKPAGATRKVSKATAEEEDSSKPRVRLLFGSQTGTAERFAKQLAGQLRKKYAGTAFDVVDLESFTNPVEQLPKEKLVVFCLATYGDGEPTDNAAEFFTWLDSATTEAEARGPVLLRVSAADFLDLH